MNPVLILTKNNLALTQRCIESVRKQDIPVSIHVYDNASTDGTPEWIEAQPDIIPHSYLGLDLGVTRAWNHSLNALFASHRMEVLGPQPSWNASHVLCAGNDTVLPPWGYRRLLEWNIGGNNAGLVTGVATDKMADIETEPAPSEIYDLHPDFSMFLIRRRLWQEIGPFNPAMQIYASDCDYHVRIWRHGKMGAVKIPIPFYHERSSTLRNASPEERERIQRQANADRQVFRSIYGCVPGEPAYENLFK